MSMSTAGVGFRVGRMRTGVTGVCPDVGCLVLVYKGDPGGTPMTLEGYGRLVPVTSDTTGLLSLCNNLTNLFCFFVRYTFSTLGLLPRRGESWSQTAR